MFNSPVTIVLGSIILMAAAYFTFKSFVKYEFEGIKNEILHVFTFIFSMASFLGAFVMLGFLLRFLH
jgi:hypothetical protein